jgi:hypothetical protein
VRSLSATDLSRLEAACWMPIVVFGASRLIAVGLPGPLGSSTVMETLILGGSRWLVLGVCGVAVFYGRASGRWVRAGLYGLVGLGLAGVPSVGGKSEGLHLVSANLQAYADEGSPPMEKALAAFGADVLVTLEKRAETLSGMRRVADNFDEDLPRPSHGTAVFCRTGLECKAEVTPEYGASECGMPVALARVERALCVVGLHLPPPVGRCNAGRAPYLEEVVGHLADGGLSGDWLVCRKGDPVVLIGDFNTLEEGDVWRELRGLGFRDPQRWRGIFATSWPAGGGWPNLPLLRLDHLLLGEDVEANKVGYRRIPGSDHKALVAWLDVASPIQGGLAD